MRIELRSGRTPRRISWSVPIWDWSSIETTSHVTSFGRIRCSPPSGSDMGLLFLHGWGSSPHVYTNALKAAGDILGTDAWAPVLPGFSGSSPLPRAQQNLNGMAYWCAEAAQALPVWQSRSWILVGHSLGGGIGLAAAARFLPKERLRHVVLLSPVGGSPQRADRGLLQLGHRVARSNSDSKGVRLSQQERKSLRASLRHPVANARVGIDARFSDLRADAALVVDAGIPLTVVSADSDYVVDVGELSLVPGVNHRQVNGCHDWLVKDPEAWIRECECFASATLTRALPPEGKTPPISAV